VIKSYIHGVMVNMHEVLSEESVASYCEVPEDLEENVASHQIRL